MAGSAHSMKIAGVRKGPYSTKQDVSFRAKTTEGHTIKVLVEQLQSCNTDNMACFLMTPQGMTLSMVDANKRMLVDMVLDSENFNVYQCPRPLTVGLNLANTHKLLKTLRKRDSITFEIFSAAPTDFYITVEPHQNARVSVCSVKIQPMCNQCIEVPVGYGHPFIVKAFEFQKCLKEVNLTRLITVDVRGGWINFRCTSGIIGREVSFGCDDDDITPSPAANLLAANHPGTRSDGASSSSSPDTAADPEDDTAAAAATDDDDAQYLYKQTFTTQYMMRLVKMSGLSNLIHIHAHPNLPLMFQLSVGELGNVRFYLKSNEQMIEEEHRSREFSGENVGDLETAGADAALPAADSGSLDLDVTTDMMAKTTLTHLYRSVGYVE
jgi:proliferating cell nuclear antigen